MITPYEFNLRQRPRFISYCVACWPSVPKDPSKRIRAECFSQQTRIPKWSLDYEKHVRLAAIEAFQNYQTGNSAIWPWQGHYCIAIRILMPHRTAADIQEVVEIVNRVNADLFYSANRNSHETSVSAAYDDKRPRVECTVFRSIAGVEFR